MALLRGNGVIGDRDLAGNVRRRGRHTAFAVLFLLAVLRVWDPSPFAGMRVGYFDFLQRLWPLQHARADVVIVSIDEASLSRHGQWPWPRNIMAQLVQAIARQSPRVVGFGVLFPEADRMAPENVSSSLIGLDAPTREAILQLPSGDAALAASFEAAPVVLGIAVDGRMDPNPTSTETDSSASQGSGLSAATDPSRFLLAYARKVGNLPILAAASQGAGAVGLDLGADGVVRQAPVALLVANAIVPSLAVEMLRVSFGGAPLALETSSDGVVGIRTPAGLVRTDSSGNMWIAFSRSDPTRYLSAADILAGRNPEGALTGKYVLIGTTAAGLGDMHPTPLGFQMRGVDIQAQILDGLLSGVALYRPSFAGIVEFALPILLSLIGIHLMNRGRLRELVLCGAIGIIGVCVFSWGVYRWSGLLIDPTFPVSALLATGAILLAVGAMADRRMAEQLAQERETRLQDLQRELLSLSRLEAVEQMSSALAHELNQPLSAISNFVQASRRLLISTDTGAVSKISGYLEKTVQQVDRAAAIVVGLRDLVQRGETKRCREDLNGAVTEAVESTFLGISSASTGRKFELSRDLPPVMINRIQIQQVMVNLVRNAVEAMQEKPGSEITILSRKATGQQVEVAVRDCGPGVDPAIERRLFEPFVSSKKKGMGIGLSISRSIIEAHGGTLTATRNAEGGMTFTFRLPIEVAGSIDADA